MTPEEHAKLDRALHLAEENNKLLLSIRRGGRVAIGMRILYWVIILGVTFGAFYFIQPYVNFFRDLAGGEIGTGTNHNNEQGASTDSNMLQKLREAQDSARSLQDLLK